MSAIDWVGLWAALQVIGTIVSILLVLIVLVGGLLYVVGGMAYDAYDRRRTRR